MKNTFSNDALIGRKAVIFAGSQGLGRAAAEKLAGMGAELVLLARTEQTLKSTAESIHKDTGAKVTPCAIDLNDETALLVCLNEHANADILVTNCGGPPVAPFEKIPLEEWDKAYRMIVRSAVIACQNLVPKMAGRGWGRVVMIASSVVVDPMRNFSLSNSLRKSLLGLAESLAEEYADRGLAANLVCPGLTETDRMRALVDGIATRTGRDRKTVLRELLGPIAVKRMAHPHEIGAVVAFLCGEEAGFIQGQAILVDGGQSVNP